MRDLRGMLRFSGMKIIPSRLMVETVEDWSRVRSPGRAARRRRKHPQNIRIVEVPKREFLVLGGDMIVAHPTMVAELERAVEAVDVR